MKQCCPNCNSTNILTLTMDDDSKKSECQECYYLDATEKFPMGEYQIALPDLQTEIDNWCDEMSVSKVGHFHKNASSMCAGVIDSQLKPWKDENKKLKLMISVMEARFEKDFTTNAMELIGSGEDMVECEDGILILSFQHTEIEDKGVYSEC